MTRHSTVLTDVAGGVWIDSWSLDAKTGPALAGSNDWSLGKRTMRGGLSDGVDVVEVNNGALSVRLLPTRGMGLWNGEYRGVRLGWNSPVHLPVNPAFVEQTARNGLGWLKGFNELLCRCGLAFNGPPGLDVVVDAEGHRSETPLTLHGHVANTPAHFVEVTVDDAGRGTLRVTGMVDEGSMFGPRLRLKSTLTCEAGGNRLIIVDEITNLASSPGEMELLYHINLGPPLLEAGARFVTAAREVMPRDAAAAAGMTDWQTYGPPEPGYAEQVFYVLPAADENGRALALLKNAAGNIGFSVSFEVAQLPCLTMWKNSQAFSDGYVTGIEPSTDFPNLRTFERSQQRLVTIPPGGSYTSRLEIAVHDSAGSVAEIEQQIADIQGKRPPVVHRSPDPRYSPAGD